MAEGVVAKVEEVVSWRELVEVGLVVHGGKSLRESKNRGEDNGREVNLGVFKSFLGEIPSDVMGERGGDTIRVDGGTIW
nr:hypothetical protein [Tanacetum cinerariifolium]